MKEVLRQVRDGCSSFKPSDETAESIEAFQAVANRLIDAERRGFLDRIYPHKSSQRGAIRYDLVLVPGGITFQGERFLKGEIGLDGGAMKSVTVNIHNSTIGQVGDGNTLNVQMNLEQMVEAIRSSDATQEEKNGALHTLKSFLGHPLTSALGGVALSAALGL